MFLAAFVCLTPRVSLKRIGANKIFQLVPMLIVGTFVAVAPSFAQNQPASPAVASSPVAAPSGQPDSAEMMKQVMELAKLSENHQRLADLAGTWNYTVKFWHTVHGAGIQRHRRQEIDDGRALLYVMNVTGKMQMPGPDGKMKDMTFKGMGIENNGDKLLTRKN